MTVFTVNSNSETMKQLSEMITVLYPDAEQTGFLSSLEALAAARETEVDVAVLDVMLPEMSGLDLGQYLKDLNPLVNLIYLTHTRDCGYDVMALHASGCLLKPFTQEDIDQVLSNAAAHLDLIAGKTEEGREAYEEVLANVRKQVRMKTNGMPLNRY